MTLEERIKALILTKYRSLRDFVNNSDIGIPYTTIDGMLKRGIFNASIQNVVSLCKTLEINVDELAKGNIVSTRDDDPVQKYAKILSDLPQDMQQDVFKYIDFLISKRMDE